MLKRTISCFLALILAVTVLPLSAFAATERPVYGDADGNGIIDLNDALILTRYIAGNNPSGFRFANADVNKDGKADGTDLTMLKKHLTEWEILLGAEILTVSFYDGDRLIDALTAEKDQPLGSVPPVIKSSKANAILEGYYLDKEFKTQFYSESPVTKNMSVYAKYADMGGGEKLSFTSFARMDMSPDVFFEIEKISGNIVPSEAVTLTAKDGSEQITITVTDDNSDGVYTVKAPGGFGEGCSYELTVAEGWNFKDKDATIRTAAFSIAMDEVGNLKMNDDIIYVKDTDSLSYNVDGKSYAELTGEMLTEQGGTFVNTTGSAFAKDDILCIFVGVNPNERDPKKGSELLEPAVYVKVTAVSGTAVSFAPLAAEEQIKLYDVPDNFPMKSAALPSADTGKINISALDTVMYKTMYGDDGTSAAAREKIGVGDFITIFVSEDAISSENDLYYGQITAYNAVTGEINYKRVTSEDIADSMDLYCGLEVSGDDMITAEEKTAIESALLSQINDSGFAVEAAELLGEMVTKTDGFRENAAVKNCVLYDKNGKILPESELKLANIGKSFELADNISLTVELITSGEQLHYSGGVQLAVKVDATFEAEVENGGKLVIDLSATFIEEVQIDPSVRGKIVTKKILFIPIPIGVSVNASIDIRNFTAFSFAADIYTVAAEDLSTWEKLKNIAKNPTEILGLPGIPDKFRDGLSSIGDVMDKIEEIKGKIDEAGEALETLDSYRQDVEDLWSFVETNGITTKEDWEQMGEQLGKTSVAADLLALMDLSLETGISAEYLEDMQALMDKYSETVQKETDWIELVDKEMFFAEINIFGLAIGTSANFTVRTDVSIAIGSDMEYEVGKRYNFWFKIGLFKPTAGSSTMDLLDEHFAFKFYVMGRVSLKAGVRVKLYVGIGSGKLASVGIAAELGPYVDLYGFFVYEYTKYRPAGTSGWTSNERMAGAMYLEFGLYVIVSFEASALGDLFEYSHDFINAKYPLLTIGSTKFYYANAYAPEEDEKIIIRDEDGNGSNGITMRLPESTKALSYMTLDTGVIGSESLSNDNYIYKLSNPNFTYDPATDIISVKVPTNTRYMECDLTITYRYGKVAFSEYDMSVTVPLVWTNLSTAELSEYYTASVRVGNDRDGYITVWEKRLLKNKQFDLPTETEIMELMGWNDAKYEASSGYNGIKTTGLTLIEDKVYDYKVDYKTYSVTVTGIQGKNGTTTSRTYTARYGEAFDFSDLAGTGTASNGVFTKFANVTTAATITVNGVRQTIDLSQSINAKLAEALTSGVTATAEYVDDSVTVTFSFTGVDHEDITQVIQKGTVPSITEAEAIASENGVAVKDIFPELGATYGSATYQVVFGELVGEKVTVSFNENGGSDVADITKVAGSLIGKLPVPERKGWSFGGWYTDNGTFANEFTAKKMPAGGIQVYAKWIAESYTVSFNVNGGNELATADKTKSVTHGSTYGKLPAATKSGFGFAGWFTSAEGGTEVTETTAVSITAAQTLYAHWKQLKEISSDIYYFKNVDNDGVYCKGTVHYPRAVINSSVDGSQLRGYVWKYMRQGDTEYSEPINAGTYNITVSRPADNDYAKFEYTYENVFTISKATRTLGAVGLETVDCGYTYVKLKLAENAVDDLGENAKITYRAWLVSGDAATGDEIISDSEGYLRGLNPGSDYLVKVTVTGDPNYEDTTSAEYVRVSTAAPNAETWGSHTEPFTVTDNKVKIETAGQLAYLAKQVNSGVTYSGVTFTLENDINLLGYSWISIGTDVETLRYFCGVFDGQGHTVYNAYTYNSEYNNALFGNVSNAVIKNLVVGDSYFCGMISGGVADSAVNSVIDSCVNYATVCATNEMAGGIAASALKGTRIVNCANYGKITGVTITGGIVGFNYGGTVSNCANFGNVHAGSEVGGIAGENGNSSSRIYNCYNIGKVTGTGKYIGSVCGRNYKDDGDVHQCYYLQGTATCNGSSRNAVGTEKSSLSDGDKGTKTAYFTSLPAALSRVCEDGANGADLITALNLWAKRCADEYGASDWVADSATGYPLPASLPAISMN